MRRGIALTLFSLLACDDPARPAPATVKSASPPAPVVSSKAPSGDGCVRTGSLDGIESDATCVVTRTSDDVNRTALKHAKMEIDIDPTTVVAGAAAVVRLTITNAAASEVMFVFDAQPRASGPRVDWSRIAGIPEVKPTTAETPRVIFPMTTLDAHDHNVDAPPTVPNSIDVSATTLIAVRVRAGGKLTQTFPWWALKIPAPAPIVKDDAGHRYIPKTAAIPLWPGEYSVVVEIPLHGIPTPERIVSARVHVDKPEKPAK
jgi:hypothetical protein